MNCQGNFNQAAGNNLVYLNKIYYDNSAVSCPILYSLTTVPTLFTQQFTVGERSNGCGCGCDNNCGCGCGNNCGCGCGNSCGCGCGNNGRCGCNCGCGCTMTCSCCDFTITENTTFHITDSHIIVDSFRLSPNAPLTAANVTVDGFPVTALSLMNGQYVADLSGIMDDITNSCPFSKPSDCSCIPDDGCNMVCDNDGHFFLAQVPGPWELGATIVIEGTATDNNRTCKFKLCMRTPISATADMLTVPGSDNFALYCVDIPCQTAGISPTMVFDFDACASLLNPALTVSCNYDTCTLSLSTTLVLTPELRLQVTKPALFNLNATEVEMACDYMGQCDPCDPENCCCEETRPTDCGCGRSQAAAPTVAANRATCTSCNNFTVACQCCETNGYSF